MESNNKSWSLSARTALIIAALTITSTVLLGVEIYRWESAVLFQQKYLELQNKTNRFNCHLSKYLGQVTEISNNPDLDSLEKIEHINHLLHPPAKNLIKGTEITLGYYLNSIGEFVALITESSRNVPIAISKSDPQPEILAHKPPLNPIIPASGCREIYHAYPIYYDGKLRGYLFTCISTNAVAAPLKIILPKILQKTWHLMALGFCLTIYGLKSARSYNMQLAGELEVLEKAYLQCEEIPGSKQNLPVEFSLVYDKYRRLAQENRKLAQELSLSFRMATTGQMIMAMAHDIRNPLAVIKTSAELGKATRDRSRQTTMLENIIAAGDTIEIFLNRYLNLNDPPPDIKEEIALGEIFNPLLAVIKCMLDLKDLRLEVEAEEGINEVKIYGDRIALAQVFLNLFSNAVEATPKGNLIKLVKYRENQTAVLILTDTGHGIPEAIQPRVFERFFTTRKNGGIGLGLALVKRVVENHGGSIWFESEAGRGTAFFVKLPLQGHATHEQ